MICPEKILNRKSASKAELREALATALGLPCPEWAKPANQVYATCRSLFAEMYEKHTGMDYSWQAKDAGCLNSIIKKIYGIAKSTEDGSIIYGFEYMLRHLPAWYLEKGLSLCVLNSKFNEIISEIKNGSKQGKVSTDYKQRIFDDLRS